MRGLCTYVKKHDIRTNQGPVYLYKIHDILELIRLYTYKKHDFLSYQGPVYFLKYTLGRI